MSGRSQRNSAVEMLRLLGMFLIVVNHSVQSKALAPYGFFERFVSAISGSFGGVGDDIFFGISAWYLCMETPLFKKSCKRSWMLEKQLLFYSILMYGVFLGLRVKFDLTIGYSLKEFIKLGISSLFPFITSLWWYTTSYILFLLLHKWINMGLRSLGRENHRKIALVMLTVWAFIPLYRIDIGYNVVLFLFLYTLVSYCRWYEPWVIQSRKIRNRSLGVGLISGLVISAIPLLRSSGSAMYMNRPWLFPSLLISFGILLAAHQMPSFHSKVVNSLASATLAPFLILCYPASLLLPEQIMGNFSDYSPWSQLLINWGLSSLVFLVGLGVDLLRQVIFSFTVDRTRNRGFEFIYAKLSELVEIAEIQISVFKSREVNSHEHGKHRKI